MTPGPIVDAKTIKVPAKSNVPVYWTYRAGKPGMTDLLMSAKCDAGSDASLKKLPVTAEVGTTVTGGIVTSVLVIDLVTEKTSRGVSASTPRQFHSPTTRPLRATSRQVVCDGRAALAIASMRAGSNPSARGEACSHVSAG